MGGLLVDAMVNPGDGSKKDSTSAPLMVVENGCGSPCIDLRQVSSELAAAAKDADLVYTKNIFSVYTHSNEISFVHCLMFDDFAGYFGRYGKSSSHKLQRSIQMRVSQGLKPLSFYS